MLFRRELSWPSRTFKESPSRVHHGTRRVALIHKARREKQAKWWKRSFLLPWTSRAHRHQRAHRRVLLVESIQESLRFEDHQNRNRPADRREKTNECDKQSYEIWRVFKLVCWLQHCLKRSIQPRLLVPRHSWWIGCDEDLEYSFIWSEMQTRRAFVKGSWRNLEPW